MSRVLAGTAVFLLSLSHTMDIPISRVQQSSAPGKSSDELYTVGFDTPTHTKKERKKERDEET